MTWRATISAGSGKRRAIVIVGTRNPEPHPINVLFKSSSRQVPVVRKDFHSACLAAFFLVIFVSPLFSQSDQKDGNPQPAESKRIFGIIPNYRTSPSLVQYKPLTVRQKFTIAQQDALDRGTFVLGRHSRVNLN